MYTTSSLLSSKWTSPATLTDGVAHSSSLDETESTSTRCWRVAPNRQKRTGPRSKPKPCRVTTVWPAVIPPGGPPLTVTASIRSE
eukprot:2123762-Prymnesium_polylepis.3